MLLEFVWHDEMHDEQDDIGMEVGHQEKADTTDDHAEEFGLVVAADATSEAICNLHMEANN